VTICPQCGEENPDRAKFCLNCAAPLLPEAAPSREARKTVTVLFCDVTGSTALGERLDPEPLRALLARYFERMKAIVERHGGTVEKFIGDAVMAVFGVPVVHEDDALRAVRAAAEMRAAFPELGVEGRIGITTGEVVTGTEERLATGDAVNVAARLEQAAQPGEVLLGEETVRLIRRAADVEAIQPLALKGKAESVPAYRLLSVPAEEPGRPAGAPMVGRGREQRLLADAWERVASERSCHLFTILGPAGVGKSRLAAEFLASAEGATVARGRCLAYGEGITYWPVVEVVKQLPDAELDEVAATTIDGLLGEQALISSSEEIAWAFRKLLEAVAAEQPLVCVFDDVHWGEETFLDLVEHVADLGRDAPILLLCMARPELLDRRSGWGGGKMNATTVLLEPLAPEQTELLIASLAEVDDSVRARISEAAEGNPLFVEEMVAMLRESADGDVVVPPTIQALLAARLDQLDPQERDVLQCGSVEGRVFHRGAVQALAPEEPHVTARLTALVRKELVRPDKAQLPREDAFRFRHLLIRDAAYDALPKATRAELHERFAAWLEEHGRDLVELDEILGHHLEQSSRYRAELGRPNQVLAGRAGERVAAAGRRAQARGDMPAAARLLRRAASLLPDEAPERPDLMLALGMALSQAGELGEADAVLGETVGAAIRAGSRRLEHQALIERLARRMWSRSVGSVEELEQAIARAIPVFEAEGDELGLARAYKWRAEIYNSQSRIDKRAQALEAALLHAQAAGDAVEENEIINYLAGVLVVSSTPAEEAIRRCEDLLDRPATGPVAKVMLTGSLAHLHARRGSFEQARRLISSAKETATELGLRWCEARLAEPAGWISLLEGDPEAAEREFSRGCQLFEAMGERARRATTTFWVAEAVYRQGRLDEAEQLARSAEELGQEEFPGVRAKVLATRGELAEAETLAHRAAELARQYQALFTYWLLDAGEVFRLVGREHEAESAIEEALAVFEQSGNLVMAERARRLLASATRADVTDLG
jgi:class 3 adenylate cyclase/tetratricopeptide (TPR) repeat protein